MYEGEVKDVFAVPRYCQMGPMGGLISCGLIANW